MPANWRELIAGFGAQRLQEGRFSPALKNLREILRASRELGVTRKTEAREEASKMRLMQFEAGLRPPEEYKPRTYEEWVRGKEAEAGMKKLTLTEEWREDLNKYNRGEITGEELMELYPEPVKVGQIKEMESKKQLLGAPPLQRADSLWERRKKEFAAIDQETADYAETIVTIGDLERFLEEIPSLKAQGINTDALLKYYQEIGLIEVK